MSTHDDNVSVQQLQEKLIRIANQHFAHEMLPGIISEKIHPDNFIAVINGSVSFGYCDAHSDVDLTVYIKDISNSGAFAHNSMPEQHSEGTRVSYRFADFGEIGQLLDGQAAGNWGNLSPYLLFGLASWLPLHDTCNVVGRLKAEYAFYPENEFVRVVRGLWITICDSGLYQSKQSFERGNHTVSDTAFFRGLEALMRMIYTLNQRYFPPTKWLQTGLERLDNRFGWDLCSANLQSHHRFETRYDACQKIVKNIKNALRKGRIFDEECIENYGANFRHPFRVFSSF